jgi:Holliday junction resolvase RusA-like endonuclease
MICTLMIPGWMPVPLNKMLGHHWGTATKHKRADRLVVKAAVLAYHVPRAEVRRRVTVLVVLPKGKRAPDPDALYKSLLDAMVEAGALVNDSYRWVVADPVEFARGDKLTTFVTLEDVP